MIAAVVLGVVSVPAASAMSLAPPRGKTFFGVSDRGTTEEFREFARLVRHHPALLQTFHPWGNSLNEARERWAQTKTRPILHISTADDQTLEELITPRAIARGLGDNYLLQLNSFFAGQRIRAYVRPLGEPNRCLNPWSAITCSGARRGGPYKHGWYKKAFRRIAVIVRGGGTLEQINARLRRAGVAPLNRRGKPEPRQLLPAPVSIMWSPLPGGSPAVPGNYPGNYWPGGRYVDWVGSDLYSAYPVWRNLNHFFRNPRYRRFPFALTEFAVAGSDNTRFMRQVFAWAKRRTRVRMLVYYRGFGEEGNAFRIGLYPRSARLLRRKLRQRRFPEYAPNYTLPAPEPPPPSGGVGTRIESTSAAPRG